MQPLVAAAADQTGRTITALSLGLVLIALLLVALTVWYWRFTSPDRQGAGAVLGPDGTVPEPGGAPDSADVDEVTDQHHAIVLDEPEPVTEEANIVVEESEPVAEEANVVVEELEPVTEVDEPAPVIEEAPITVLIETELPDPVVDLDDADLDDEGLDADQWSALTQAVFEQYLEPHEIDGGSAAGNGAGPGAG